MAPRVSIAFPAALSLILVLQGQPASAQSLIGDCEPSTAEAYLDANNVYARIPINGQLFYRGEPHVYRVPRFSSSNAIFASSIVIGGLVDDVVHLAGTRYGPAEFWAGPLDDNGAPPQDCSAFDHIYNVDRRDLEAFERDGSASYDLLNWPTGLGAPTLDANGNRMDVSGLSYEQRLSRNIDLVAGERPELVGNQALWWISNDRGSTHDATDTEPLGIELHGLAYAVSSPIPAINNATYYRYRVVNRNSKPIRRAYFGIYVDPDLGDAGDDYIGTDTLRNIGYVYNADDNDGGGEGYGRAPPAVGFRILRGPRADEDGFDNDRDGIVDESEERPGLSHLLWFHNGGGPTSEPGIGIDYYNYMSGRWKSGEPLLYGGDGYNYKTTEEHANVLFPGDPATGEGWTEVNPCAGCDPNPQNDKRWLMSSGPFDLAPGEAKEIDFAVVYGRGTDHLDSIDEMRRASDGVQAAFDSDFEGLPQNPLLDEPVELLSPSSGAADQPTSLRLEWDPVPGVLGYQVILQKRIGFSEFETAGPFLDLTRLKTGSVYSWRVKAYTQLGDTGFSDTRWFTTASQSSQRFPLAMTVVANASGPLPSPDLATYTLPASPAPQIVCPTDPSVLCGDPTRGYQQSRGGAIWVLGSAYRTSGYDAIVDGLTGRGSLNQVIGNADYELRWVGFDRGARGYDASLGDTMVDVGFELWNIGIDTPDDLSDDYRMIPFVQLSLGADGWESPNRFSIDGDYRGHPDSNDPYSNYITWRNPQDRTPGERGYLQFFSRRQNPGPVVFEDMVLVNLDGGSPGYPESGTVFRIRRLTPPAPSLASPADEAVLVPGAARFFWNGIGDRFRLQLSSSPNFTGPVTTLEGVTSGVSVAVSEKDQYYWRVESDSTGWSNAWSFRTLETPGTAKDDARFTDFGHFPNPADGLARVRFYLRETATATLEISDVLGRRVRTATLDELGEGLHVFPLDTSRYAAGLYFYTLWIGNESRTKTLVVAH